MDVALLQSFIQLVNPSLGIAMVVLALLLVFYPRRRSTATLEVTQVRYSGDSEAVNLMTETA